MRIAALLCLPLLLTGCLLLPGEFEAETIGRGVFILRTTAEIVATNGAVSTDIATGETLIRWSSEHPLSEKPEAIVRLDL